MNVTLYINNGIKDSWSLFVKKENVIYIGVIYLSQLVAV